MKRLNRRSNGSYRFLVAYPLKLRRLIPSLPSQYSRELPSIDDSSTELAKLTAVAKATEAYNLHLKMLQVSDPQSYTESERALAIDEVLRRREIKAGEFHYDDFSDEAFPELGTSIPPDNDRKKPLTFRESVLIDAYFTSRKLPTIKRERTFRQAWNDYLARQLIDDVSQGLGKEKQQRFERVIAITGDFTIADETKNDVLDRLQQFIAVKQAEGAKAQTIKRSLKEVFAAIRSVPRLAWSDAVTLNPTKNSLSLAKDAAEIKARVLTLEELDTLIDTCLRKPDALWTCLLLQLHAGLGPMEIKRLRLEKDVHLYAPVPHILFRGGDERKTKTSSRVRVVPIVVGLEVIREWLPSTHEWLSGINDRTPSISLNKRLRNLLNVATEDSPHIKTQGLRHTWLRLARRANIGARQEHAIGGWSRGSDNEINRLTEVVYDPNGFVDDIELLKQLYEAQTQVFARWITKTTPS